MPKPLSPYPYPNNFFLRRISKEEAARRAAEIKEHLKEDGQTYTEGTDVHNLPSLKTMPKSDIEAVKALKAAANANGGNGNVVVVGGVVRGQTTEDILRKRSAEAQAYMTAMDVLSRTREGIVAHSAATRQERIRMAKHLQSFIPRPVTHESVRKDNSIPPEKSNQNQNTNIPNNEGKKDDSEW